MTIRVIACIDMANGLGYKNELLCKLSNDMKRFKLLTTGYKPFINTVLMGSNTYESVGNLPNRNLVVASRSKEYKDENVHVTRDVHEFIRQWKTYSLNKDLWIIGGGEVYKQTLQYVDEIYLTVIDHEFQNVDVYFPKINESEWKLINIEKNYKDENNKYNYHYWTFRRKH